MRHGYGSPQTTGRSDSLAAIRNFWIVTGLLAAGSAASADETRLAEIRERLQNANAWRDHVMVVAHRAGGLQKGKTLFPENSLAAARNAIELGAEMIEVDVQKSRDGEYVVFHDSWLDRTSTCKGRLAERTLVELKTCRLVVEGNGAATDETVPTLGEMLAVTRDHIFVNIDNKLDLAELPGIVAVARDMGMADQLVIKQNLWNPAKVAEANAVVEQAGPGPIFMPIIADDAVRDVRFLESATRAVAADAVELIAWREQGSSITATGGPLFGARARAVAARGDWHLWVNTYAIVNKSGGMLARGRGDELAVAAGLPEETYGFWAEQGATMIQTDEPEAAISWLLANGYRVPYSSEVQAGGFTGEAEPAPGQ
jgi:glycerophosphoryl diester phosphodiesterase